MCSQTNFACCVTGSTAHSTISQCNDFSLAPSLLTAGMATFVAHLTRELDVQRRFKSTAMAAQADKLRNHIQIISDMTEDELQHLRNVSDVNCPSLV